MSATLVSRPPQNSSNFAPRVALVKLDSAMVEILQKAFAQCGIDTVVAYEDFATRLAKEQFQGCVVNLDEHALITLDAVRSSRSNRRMILYGIVSAGIDVRAFSRYGINTLLGPRPDRTSVLNAVRSTCALLLHELRRYVRIPLVIAISAESQSGQRFFGSTREISGGGMSVQFTGNPELSGKVRLSFSLPDKPSMSVAAVVCWQNGDSTGLQFETSDSGRQGVKSWIDSFLGLD
ncbi:MAG TPA: PilZ domain-containing protein [Terriglobales bacterium]|nr:PilZ domain-containing protein [Terriglobales bacterium]